VVMQRILAAADQERSAKVELSIHSGVEVMQSSEGYNHQQQRRHI